MTEKNGDSSSKAPLPPLINFINGGTSGMLATCVVHPMDVVKNRMQMCTGSTTLLAMMKRILAEGGFFNFYRGLTAGLVRQATYTTFRLGTYNQLLDIWKTKYTNPPSFFMLCLMASTAGVCGAFVGTPAEVALVRMSSDGRLPPEQKRNYKNVVDAFVRIHKEEGIKALWRGTIPTMGRAAVVNVSQLATYSQAKTIIAKKYNVNEGLLLHFYASMISGLVTTFNSMPFDNAKTRIQNMKGCSKLPGMISTLMTIASHEGITALWKGFIPTYCRIGPHTVLTLIFNEQLAKYYRENFT